MNMTYFFNNKLCYTRKTQLEEDFLQQNRYFEVARTGRPGDQGSIPGRGERTFPVASVSRLAVRPIQPPIKCVSEVLCPGLKRGRA
jgi:hypothetical protein